MKTMTTTKATHRGVDIFVMTDKIGYQTMYTCSNTSSRGILEEKWFPTQGEAIANERYVIDRILGKS
jgi:hypothetical protein